MTPKLVKCGNVENYNSFLKEEGKTQCARLLINEMQRNEKCFLHSRNLETKFMQDEINLYTALLLFHENGNLQGS